MAFRLNQEAVEHALNLIQGQQYETDSDWREVQASAEEENRYIDENGWEASARWFQRLQRGPKRRRQAA
jgi:hypothetical protein